MIRFEVWFSYPDSLYIIRFCTKIKVQDLQPVAKFKYVRHSCCCLNRQMPKYWWAVHGKQDLLIQSMSKTRSLYILLEADPSSSDSFSQNAPREEPRECHGAHLCMSSSVYWADFGLDAAYLHGSNACYAFVERITHLSSNEPFCGPIRLWYQIRCLVWIWNTRSKLPHARNARRKSSRHLVGFRWLYWSSGHCLMSTLGGWINPSLHCPRDYDSKR